MKEAIINNNQGVIRSIVKEDPTHLTRSIQYEEEPLGLGAIPPLSLAALTGQAEAYYTLLELRASCKATDLQCQNLLRYAVFGKNLQILKDLIDKQFDVNEYILSKKLVRTYSPLDIAQTSDNFQGAILLMERGADFKQLDRAGYPFLENMFKKKQTEILVTILEDKKNLASIIPHIFENAILFLNEKVLLKLFEKKTDWRPGLAEMYFRPLLQKTPSSTSELISFCEKIAPTLLKKNFSFDSIINDQKLAISHGEVIKLFEPAFHARSMLTAELVQCYEKLLIQTSIGFLDANNLQVKIEFSDGSEESIVVIGKILELLKLIFSYHECNQNLFSLQFASYLNTLLPKINPQFLVAKLKNNWCVALSLSEDNSNGLIHLLGNLMLFNQEIATYLQEDTKKKTNMAFSKIPVKLKSMTDQKILDLGLSEKKENMSSVEGKSDNEIFLSDKLTLEKIETLEKTVSQLERQNTSNLTMSTFFSTVRKSECVTVPNDNSKSQSMARRVELLESRVKQLEEQRTEKYENSPERRLIENNEKSHSPS